MNAGVGRNSRSSSPPPASSSAPNASASTPRSTNSSPIHANPLGPPIPRFRRFAAITPLVSIDLYIPTGCDPGLNALPVRYRSIFAPVEPAVFLLASALYPCTLVFKPQPLEPRRVATTSPTRLRPEKPSRSQSPTYTISESATRGDRHKITLFR